jgi:hypothetical protein
MALLQKHQRLFLVKDWETRINAFSEDRDERGRLGPGAVEMVDGGERFVEWLRGGCSPHPQLREFVEQWLAVFDRETEYEQLAYEHDAVAAALEDLS